MCNINSTLSPHDALSLLLPEDQRQWLAEHIPHRVRAVLPGIPILGNWKPEWNATIETDPITWRCMGNSMWEGRLTSMRWLIMLVGISAKGDKWEPWRPTVYDKDKDVFITRIDGGQGQLFPFDEEGKKLALVWAGCSKATAHPTNRTSHPDVYEPQLAEPLVIVMNHLQETIYAKAGKSLIDFTVTMKTPQQLLAEW
jgi:hypothetical protein